MGMHVKKDGEVEEDRPTQHSMKHNGGWHYYEDFFVIEFQRSHGFNVMVMIAVRAERTLNNSLRVKEISMKPCLGEGEERKGQTRKGALWRELGPLSDIFEEKENSDGLTTDICEGVASRSEDDGWARSWSRSGRERERFGEHCAPSLWFRHRTLSVAFDVDGAMPKCQRVLENTLLTCKGASVPESG